MVDIKNINVKNSLIDFNSHNISSNKINEIILSSVKKLRDSQPKRTYLGASQIGEQCLRKVQLYYERPELQNFPPKLLMTFDIGHALESTVISWLTTAGFEIESQNENGKQFGFSIANGRIQGQVDGIIRKFPPELENENTGTPCLFECKTMNNKSWNETAKIGVRVSKPVYFAQVQIYMAYMELTDFPCLFTALNKNTSELYHELIPFDQDSAQKYSDRAITVIKSTQNNEIIQKLSNDPSFYICKMCGFHDACHDGRNI